MKQRVVIIGRRSLIRSWAKLGCEITVVVTVLRGWLGRMVHFEGGKPVDCCSKYVSRYLYGSGQDEEKLIALLLEKCACHGQKTILIPDSDFSAAAVDRYQERLAADFLFPHIGHTPGAVEHWMHKTVQKALAAEVGLPVTRDCTVQVRSGRYVTKRHCAACSMLWRWSFPTPMCWWRIIWLSTRSMLSLAFLTVKTW